MNFFRCFILRIIYFQKTQGLYVFFSALTFKRDLSSVFLSILLQIMCFILTLESFGLLCCPTGTFYRSREGILSFTEKIASACPVINEQREKTMRVQ